MTLECQVRGCDYEADSADGLKGHVRGKSPHDDRHADALEMGALEEWATDDQAGDEDPSALETTAELPDGPGAVSDTTGATDAEVAEAVAEVEDAGDYDAQWSQNDESDTESAASTEPADGSELPTTWLVVGTVVLLVVLVLVLSTTGGASTDETVAGDEEEDGPIDPSEIEVIGGEL